MLVILKYNTRKQQEKLALSFRVIIPVARSLSVNPVPDTSHHSLSNDYLALHLCCTPQLLGAVCVDPCTYDTSHGWLDMRPMWPLPLCVTVLVLLVIVHNSLYIVHSTTLPSSAV